MTTRPKIPSLFNGISGPKDKIEELKIILERLGQLLASLTPWQTDNLITFGKNLSFLDDRLLTSLVLKHAVHEYDKAIIWRTHILSWAAQNALNVPGDFVECGTHLGYSVSVIADYVRITETGRRFWCYDLFEGAAYASFDLEGQAPLDYVQQKFVGKACIKLVKGPVPQSLAQQCPAQVAFLHLDLNNALAEKGALEHLVPLMTKGAIVVLDDYGWQYYRAQKLVADELFGAIGVPIVELPTGQGLAIIA